MGGTVTTWRWHPPGPTSPAPSSSSRWSSGSLSIRRRTSSRLSGITAPLWLRIVVNASSLVCDFVFTFYCLLIYCNNKFLSFMGCVCVNYDEFTAFVATVFNGRYDWRWNCSVKDALFRQKFTPDLPEIISLFLNSVIMYFYTWKEHIFLIILLKYHLTSYILIFFF